MAATPIQGRLSDRYGRKPVLIASLVGTAAASLATGLAGSLWVLFAARTLDGVSGSSVSVAQAAVADIAPPARRPQLLGMLGAAFGVGFTLGPAIGGLASWLGGPRAPFFVAAALAAANAVAAVRRLPETRGTAVVFADASPQPVSDGLATSWRENGLPLLIAVAFGAVFAFSAFEGTFAIFGRERIGFTQATSGAAFTIVGVMITVVQVGLVGRTVERLGEVGTLRFGLAVTACGLLALAATRSWVVLVPALMMLCVGQGLVSPTMTSTSVSRIHPAHRGAVLGTQQSMGSLARVLGPAFGGWMFDHVSVPSPLLGGAAVLGLCVMAMFIGATPRTRVSDSAGSAPLTTVR